MIERISSGRGVVCGLALDHRDSLRVAARRRGYPDDAGSLRALKVELVRGLAPFTTVVLLDVELGLDAFTERGGTPLIVPLEAQGYETLGEGRITTLLGDVDPARAAALGAVGYIVGRTAWDAALVEDDGELRRAVSERAAFLARAVQVAEAG